MRNFIKKHNIWLKVISLLISITLWSVIMKSVNPEKTPKISGIPITLYGRSDLLENTGLTVIETSDETVTVQIRGDNSVVSQSNIKNRITAVVNVSGVTDTGWVTLPVTASVSYSNVDVIGVIPDTIRVRVEKEITKEVPVKLGITGTVASGYQVGAASSATETITIQGPESDLQNVESAYAVVDVSGATNMVTQDCAVVLSDAAGDPVDTSNITITAESIRVTVQVYEQDTIPLNVILKESDEVTRDMVEEVKITPETVKVYGDQNVIETMSEINLGEIDLANVRTDSEIEMPIRLPDGVYLADGQPETAGVVVTITGVSTKTVTIDRASVLISHAGEDTGTYAVRVDESVDVELRGASEDLEGIDASNITVTVVVDSSDLGVGTHEAQGLVTAKSLPEGVTILNDKVTVKVTIEYLGDSE